MSWEEPYEGFAGKYEVALESEGILVWSGTKETEQTSFVYEFTRAIANVGAIAAVRPVLGDWKGEASGYFIAVVNALGVPVYTGCDGIISGAIGILDPQTQNRLLEPANDAGAMQEEDARIEASPTTTTSSPDHSTRPADTTTTASDGREAETTTSSRPVTRTGSPTAPTTSTRTPQSTAATSTSPTQVTTSRAAEKAQTSTSVTTVRNEPAPQPDNPATSTTQAPATAIPDEPGRLSTSARTDDVATITAGDEELDVVVKGTRTPTDARAGAAALEARLTGGNPDPTWATFASKNPDHDGWRWAAINQETGTTVYIR